MLFQEKKAPIDMVPANVDVETSQDPEFIFDMDDEEVYGCKFSELEGLTVGIEGLDEFKCGEQIEEQQQQQEGQAELNDDEFWHQLFTGEIGDETGTTGLFAQNDDDVDALGDRLVSLGSTSPM
ncbi:hypothetical protein HPP92_020901 [Vanilla planifolia]|uniref:Uncharacterized protein n=1 Tax=Vanilla planifolia TaxID=51239 RepID=A0A835PXX3_VANPL|nr:hypothetical protein HPP92_020901 [Vanilla planifolia]